MSCHCHGRAQQLWSGVRGDWDDPRLTSQAVIWVERGDQSCYKNTDMLLCHSLGELCGPSYRCVTGGAVAPRPERFALSDSLQEVPQLSPELV